MTRNLPILFILITVVIDSMGIGLIMPVMPDLIPEVTGGDLAGAAVWGGVLATAFAVMQFLFGPVVGSLSDWIGRRPVLLVTLFVMTLDYLVMAVAGAMWLLACWAASSAASLPPPIPPPPPTWPTYRRPTRKPPISA